MPFLELVHTLPVSPLHPTQFFLFSFGQLEVHTQGDSENPVLKMSGTPDRRTPESLFINKSSQLTQNTSFVL